MNAATHFKCNPCKEDRHQNCFGSVKSLVGDEVEYMCTCVNAAHTYKSNEVLAAQKEKLMTKYMKKPVYIYAIEIPEWPHNTSEKTIEILNWICEETREYDIVDVESIEIEKTTGLINFFTNGFSSLAYLGSFVVLSFDENIMTGTIEVRSRDSFLDEYVAVDEDQDVKA